MTPNIPAELETRINRRVLDHLAGKSAHSDVESILNSGRGRRM